MKEVYHMNRNVLLQRIITLPNFKLKELRDNINAPYNVRRAAANLLVAKEIDSVRKTHTL
jgi:hypothetical protein